MLKTNIDNQKTIIPSSFRDPSGFLFYKNNEIYRQVNIIYKENYDYLMKSGLYKELIKKNLLISHEEKNIKLALSDDAYKVIKPQQIPFVSYPYEWCFSQLKAAALVTLEIQKIALKFGMSLKDASAYNIQFLGYRPIFIDTLSFEKYSEGKPWIAYKQFCQHFLAPLALMAHRDVRLNQLLRIHIDGIPLDLVSRLLPIRTWYKISLLLHIHLHAKSQKHFAKKINEKGSIRKKFTRYSFLALVDNLESSIRKLEWKPGDTEWRDYYEGDSYESESFKHKQKTVSSFLDKIKPGIVWDLGANTGFFSRIASDKDIFTVSFDIDPMCVEINYQTVFKNRTNNILPLLIDLTNPIPGIGWENNERDSFIKRGPADTILALALIHHLAISNNLPFDKIAKFLRKICNSLIIEFIPKSDIKVKRLLSMREDIFSEYTQRNFEEKFDKYFKIKASAKIKNSERILYLMIRK